jgi:hypothetical protein
MKLTDEQKLQKQKHDNVVRLKNRVLSEYQFKKWRNYHSYLRSLGRDNDFIAKQPDKDLTFQELKDLLNEFQTETLSKKAVSSIHDGRKDAETDKEGSTDSSILVLPYVSKDGKVVQEAEEKLEASNNYGLKESKKEVAILLWFQRKASAELLKGFI